MKNISAKLFIIIGICSLVAYTNTANAHPKACQNISTHAAFLPASGIVCLQKIKVTDRSGTQFYKASLQWLGTEKPGEFELLTVDSDSSTKKTSPSFSTDTGVLKLPKVEIANTLGTDRYAVNLVFNPQKGRNIFEITMLKAYINPDYIQGETWKPYGMLNASEKNAVKRLSESLIYAPLANAIYSFANTTVGNWTLIEQISEGSGMQAGVFKNQKTGELVIAFRGTETCDLPCSFSETKESTLDLTADTLITFGKMSAQFRHALLFAEDILNRYPDEKITVTGHSLGGALAQAIGSTLELKTFAFNSAPVPDDFFTEYPTHLSTQELNQLVHVIADIRDPVSHSDESGETYLNAAHVSPILQFDFAAKEIMPDDEVNRLEELYKLRFDKHSMTMLIDNSAELLAIYRQGW